MGHHDTWTDRMSAELDRGIKAPDLLARLEFDGVNYDREDAALRLYRRITDLHPGRDGLAEALKTVVAIVDEKRYRRVVVTYVWLMGGDRESSPHSTHYRTQEHRVWRAVLRMVAAKARSEASAAKLERQRLLRALRLLA